MWHEAGRQCVLRVRAPVLYRDAAVNCCDCPPRLPDIVRPGNMVMENDAQKVIAISLGKIATSRVQRGGPSLHRSLLVASVLYKARTTYLDDALQANNGASPGVCVHGDGGEAASGGDCAAVAKPNRTVTLPVTYEDCASGGDDKENVEPSATAPECPPSRYPKRRRAHSDDDEGGGKRSRLWRRSSSFCESDEQPELDCLLATTDLDQTQEVAAAADAMEVESISNLVLAFNTGLKGISSSLPDLCSAQSAEVLRTAFSPPVVALTV